jgi:hypothetical protein
MGYFDNFGNEFLNKYKKCGHLNFMQFHYRLIVHQRSLNYNRYKLYKILMVLDEISNNNEIT